MEGAGLYLKITSLPVPSLANCRCPPWGFPSSSVVKNLPAIAEEIRDAGSIPELGRSSGRGNGTPLQYSCLVDPMDREVWRLQFLRLQSQTRLSIRVHALGWPLSVLTSLTLTYLALPPPWLHSVYILPSPGTALPQKSGHHAPHSLISDPSSSHILQRSIDLVMTSSPWTDPTAFPLPHPFLTPHHSSHQLSFHDLL